MQLILIFAFIISVGGCTSTGPIAGQEARTGGTESLAGSSKPSWTLPVGTPKYLRPRTWDLRHQKIMVRFHFRQEMLEGHTELFLTSLADSNRRVVIDAKDLEVDSVRLLPGRRKAEFRQDSAHIYLNLSHAYNLEDSLYVAVDYRVTHPRQGLYFVDPRGTDPTAPTEAWTFGHPQRNSYWLPTIDLPAERATQETWISVPDSMTTVSNGRLVERRTVPGDSLRTDYWVMDRPHAPYLFAIAAGPLQMTPQLDDGIYYRFYTDSAYTDNAAAIYADTPDMGRFIQQYVSVPYPWKFYGQVPLHEFIMGGMENTTATFLTDRVQFDRRAGKDLSNQDMVVHELAHQWFGDYVTPVNWANLSMSEGFASYFEVLYKEYHDGAEAARYHARTQKQAYLQEAGSVRRPIIWNRYSRPEALYDHHTYDKASRVLHMLRDLVGENDWRGALHHFLEQHALGNVDVDDLETAFEQQTGRDLHWFFRQWFHEPGHPILSVSTDTTGNSLEVRIKQVQDLSRQPVFRLQPKVQVITSNGAESHRIRIDRPDSTYRFMLKGTFRDFIYDPGDVQLDSVRRSLKVPQLLARLKHPSVTVRLDALNRLNEKSPWTDKVEQAVVNSAREDEFWAIRERAMELLAAHPSAEATDLALNRTLDREPDYRVRNAALDLLARDTLQTEAVKEHLKGMISDSSYFVAANAIRISGKKYSEQAYDWIQPDVEADSYQQVLKDAVAYALRFVSDHRANDDLLKLAGAPGDFNYIPTAIRSLQVRSQREPDLGMQLLQLCRQRLNDSYARTRMACIGVIGRMGDRESLPDLRELLQSGSVSGREAALLKDVIHDLQQGMPAETGKEGAESAMGG